MLLIPEKTRMEPEGAGNPDDWGYNKGLDIGSAIRFDGECCDSAVETISGEFDELCGCG
jgi:hypothetical protein